MVTTYISDNEPLAIAIATGVTVYTVYDMTGVLEHPILQFSNELNLIMSNAFDTHQSC